MKRLSLPLLTFGLFGFLIFLQGWWMAGLRVRLQDAEWYSGWVLITGVVFLVAFQLRKKLSVLPFGRLALWTRIHIFVGVTSGFLFLCHINFQWPNGFLDRILFSIFVLTFISGVIGWFFSRLIPKQLAGVHLVVVSEDIPFKIAQIKEQAHGRLLEAIEKTRSDSLLSFYDRRLEPFLSQPNFFWFRSRRPSRYLADLAKECHEIRRYLNTEEHQTLDYFLDLARQKDDLDYLFSGDRILKTWLIVHLPLSYILILLALIHLLTILLFRSGGGFG